MATDAPTQLQVEAQRRIAAQKQAEEEAQEDLMRRVEVRAAQYKAEREAREEAERKVKADALAKVQEAKAQAYEKQLLARARQNWRGSAHDFEAVWPELRRRMLMEDVLRSEGNSRLTL